MEITLEDYTMMTGDDFAEHFEKDSAEALQKRFKLFMLLAVRRVRILIGESKTSDSDMSEVIQAEKDTDDEVLWQLLTARMIGVLLSEQEAMDNNGLAQKVVEDFRLQFDKNASPALTRYKEEMQDIIRHLQCARAIRIPKDRGERGFVI